MLKYPAGFELITNRFVVNSLPNCATLMGNRFGKRTITKLHIGFIIYFNKYYVTT